MPTQEVFKAPPGVRLGTGFSIVPIESRSIGVIGEESVDPNAKGNLSTDFSLSMISTAEELDKSMEVSVGLTVRIPNFNGSAEVKFAERTKVSSKSTNIFIRLVVQQAPVSLLNARLSDEAWDLMAMKPPKLDRFNQRFGTFWVKQIVNAASFFGVARVESQDENHEHELATDVSLRIGNVLGGGTVSNQNEFSEKFNSSTDSIELFITSMGGSPQPVFNIAQLMGAVEDFHEAISNRGAVPFTMTLAPYIQLAMPSDDITFVQQQIQQLFFDDLGKLFHAHMDLKHEIEFVLRNQHMFTSVPEKELQERIRKINVNLNAITRSADKCARGGECVFPENVVLPNSSLPKRKGKSRKPPGNKPIQIANQIIMANGVNFRGPRTNRTISFNMK